MRCNNYLAGILVTLYVVCCPIQPILAADSEPWRWSDIERIVVIPDIHGAYPAFVRLLKATDIVDDSLSWTGGNSHLVSLGDLLDRGAESRKVMDLLMRLQTEAPTAGGYVHVVAGNHELMNLMGELWKSYYFNYFLLAYLLSNRSRLLAKVCLSFGLSGGGPPASMPLARRESMKSLVFNLSLTFSAV